MKKKKLLIVSGGILPVPASKGGAVETLNDSIIRENKIGRMFQIDVVSCGEGREFTDEEGQTKYIQISYPLYLRIADRIVYFYYEKIKKDWRSMFVRNRYKLEYYKKSIAGLIDFLQYDAVVVENNMSLLDVISRKMGEEFSQKCYYHMHSVLVDNEDMIPYLAKCKKILTVSDYVTGELKKSYPAFRNTLIQKVTNGVSIPEDSIISTEDLRRKYNIKKEDCVFLYSGRLSVEKGPAELLDVYVKARMEGCVLIFAGSAVSGSDEQTPYVLNMKKRAAQSENRIIFTGYIDHKEMGDFYRMADALVIPSLIGDAAPLTALEGMAYGLPIVAARVGGIPEYAKRYDSIFWAEPGENFKVSLSEQLQNFANRRPYRKANPCHFDTHMFFESFCEAISD